MTEGCVVENAALRAEDAMLRYQPVEYPSKGWCGFYPGPVQMQYMAYYTDDAGLYIGAHDARSLPKAIEYHVTEPGVRLEYRIFVAVAPHTEYRSDFAMVLRGFTGDWMAAAEIYRAWIESVPGLLPPKSAENSAYPEWLQDSPLVVIYPVRGEKDTGQMNPNEYYPYTNALATIEGIAERTGARVLALLMHWEGTAPWAPPYIWPPYGGEALLRGFVRAMHEKGNLVGLYASGIGWTDESVLCPEYRREEERVARGLTECMCKAPDQSLPHSLICNGPIRWGYDMCPANDVVRTIAIEEAEKAARAEIDYLQFFDQNLGGTSYLCYANDHGHVASPGVWQVEAMKRLYADMNAMLRACGAKTLLGCEAAAADCYMRYLPLNDLRFNCTVAIARPVPAYAFVFHEYGSNFMGNSNGFSAAVPFEENPESLLFRLGYSFVAGDLPSVVLKSKGEIHWDWGTAWDAPAPEQEALYALLREITRVRREARDYLVHGRMVQPVPVRAHGSFTLRRANGANLEYPPVLATQWRAADGREALVLVNYTHAPQSVEAGGTAYSLAPLSALCMEGIGAPDRV